MDCTGNNVYGSFKLAAHNFPFPEQLVGLGEEVSPWQGGRDETTAVHQTRAAERCYFGRGDIFWSSLLFYVSSSPTGSLPV